MKTTPQPNKREPPCTVVRQPPAVVHLPISVIREDFIRPPTSGLMDSIHTVLKEESYTPTLPNPIAIDIAIDLQTPSVLSMIQTAEKRMRTQTKIQQIAQYDPRKARHLAIMEAIRTVVWVELITSDDQLLTEPVDVAAEAPVKGPMPPLPLQYRLDGTILKIRVNTLNFPWSREWIGRFVKFAILLGPDQALYTNCIQICLYPNYAAGIARGGQKDAFSLRALNAAACLLQRKAEKLPSASSVNDSKTHQSRGRNAVHGQASRASVSSSDHSAYESDSELSIDDSDMYDETGRREDNRSQIRSELHMQQRKMPQDISSFFTKAAVAALRRLNCEITLYGQKNEMDKEIYSSTQFKSGPATFDTKVQSRPELMTSLCVSTRQATRFYAAARKDHYLINMTRVPTGNMSEEQIDHVVYLGREHSGLRYSHIRFEAIKRIAQLMHAQTLYQDVQALWGVLPASVPTDQVVAPVELRYIYPPWARAPAEKLRVSSHSIQRMALMTREKPISALIDQKILKSPEIVAYAPTHTLNTSISTKASTSPPIHASTHVSAHTPALAHTSAHTLAHIPAASISSPVSTPRANAASGDTLAKKRPRTSLPVSASQNPAHRPSNSYSYIEDEYKNLPIGQVKKKRTFESNSPHQTLESVQCLYPMWNGKPYPMPYNPGLCNPSSFKSTHPSMISLYGMPLMNKPRDYLPTYTRNQVPRKDFTNISPAHSNTSQTLKDTHTKAGNKGTPPHENTFSHTGPPMSQSEHSMTQRKVKKGALLSSDVC